MNLYISDLHFGHENAIKFDNRPFSSVEEMNETLVQNWNKAVSPEDTVYVLGDFFWKRKDMLAYLPRLSGKIILICGNHDGKWLKEKVEHHSYLEVVDNGRSVVLCHYPILSYNRMHYGGYHLYGHVHNSKEAERVAKCFNLMGLKNAYNCGCMMEGFDYTPLTLDEIIMYSDHPSDEVEEFFIPNDPLNEPFYGTEESEDKLYEDR